MKTLAEVQEMAACGRLIGAFRDIPINVYHAPGSPGVSKSGLDLAADYPLRFYRRCISGESPSNTTDALTFGSLFHCMLLEPARLDIEFKSDAWALELGSRGSKKFKDEVGTFIICNPGIQVVKAEWMETCRKMIESIKGNELGEMMAYEGENELSIYWIDEATRLLCKCRVDKLFPKIMSMSEWKTITSVWDFERNAAEYRYYVQQAWFEEGASIIFGGNWELVFSIIEKEEDYAMRFVRFDGEDLELARRVMHRDLATIKRCIDSGKWPKYEVDGTPQVEITGLPRWKITEERNRLAIVEE